jgi:hypothetical protein
MQLKWRYYTQSVWFLINLLSQSSNLKMDEVD